MTAAFADAGAGVITETSGAALSPLSPATVNAGDLLIIHTYWEGTATAPSTPSGFTLLDGPRSLTTGRGWVFGKVAAGTEDGAAHALGSPAVTTMRAARVYRFTGLPSGVPIGIVCDGFAFGSGTTAAINDTAVTTPEDGCLAVQLVAVADNNALVSFTGETGGDWTEAVAEFTSAATTPDFGCQIQTATVTTVGTINGGSQTMAAADPWGVTGFYIRNTAGGVKVTDTFDRANSDTIGNDSNGNTWVERAGDWDISSNGVIQTNATTVPGCLLCFTDLASNSHWVEGKLAVSDGTGQIGLVVRLDITLFTGLSFEVADGFYKLIEVSNGSPSTVFTGSAHGHTTGEVYAAEVDALGNVRFYLNGTQVAATTSAFNPGDTHVGFHLNESASGAIRWDDFRAGDGAYPGPSAPSVAATAGALTLDPVAVTPTPGPVSVAATPGTLTLDPVAVTFGGSTVAATPGQLTLDAVAVTQTPGPVSIAATPGAVTFTPVAVTQTPGPVSVAAVAGALTLDAVIVSQTPGPVSTAATPGMLTLEPVAATLPGGNTLTPGALTLTPVAVTPTPGPVTTATTPGDLTLTPIAVTATPGPVTVAIVAGQLTLEPVAAIATPSVAIVAGDLTLTPLAVTATPGGTTPAAVPGQLTLDPVPATPVPGPVSTALAAGALELIPVAIYLAASIAADPGALTLTPVPFVLGFHQPPELALAAVTAPRGLTALPDELTLAAIPED